MTAIFGPPDPTAYMIGPGTAFFVHPSEPGISRRRRRRLRGKRKAGLLPPMVAELGEVAACSLAERSARLVWQGILGHGPQPVPAPEASA
ncbi:hypothetical protein ACIQW5_26010 [Methylorubrum thiocyanatum]|uniref:hypothetical protein n=1 Tax=Methylorubrum thiocyanatum TaxID=47958 RepID=UPI00383B0019